MIDKLSKTLTLYLYMLSVVATANLSTFSFKQAIIERELMPLGNSMYLLKTLKLKAITLYASSQSQPKETPKLT